MNRRVKLGRMLEQHVVNRPLLTTPRRAEALMGIVSRELAYGGHLVRAYADDQGEDGGEGRILLSDLAASSPRMSGPRDDRKVFRLVDGVAVIPVEGDLVHKLGDLDPWCGMTGYDGITYKLHEAAADPDVLGIMLDVDSPGGMVDGCAACGDVIARVRKIKPVWASLSDNAYSAAYWLASQCNRILMPRTGGVGSVGVVTLHADHSRSLDAEGVTVTVIHAGAHKADGHPFAPLDKDVLASITAELEALRLQFSFAVASGRGMAEEAVLATEARCFLAAAGISVGFADAIANPDDALAEFIEHLAAPGGRTISAPRAAKTVQSQQEDHLAKPNAQGGGLAAARNSLTPAFAASGVADEDETDDEKDRDEACAASTDSAEAAVCESCPHNDKDRSAAPCRDCPDNPAPADDAGQSGGDSAAAAKVRVKAILAAPEAKACPNLARQLALDTDMEACAAIKVMRAAEHDAKSAPGNAFSRAMTAHAGPDLGAGGGAEGPKPGGLSAAREELYRR